MPYIRTNIPGDPFGDKFVVDVGALVGGTERIQVGFEDLTEELWFGGADVTFEVTDTLSLTAGYAYSDTTRHPSIPDVPTLSEVVPGLSVTSWHGIWAASATPAAVLTRFNSVMVEAANDPDMQKRIRALNVEPLGVSRAEMATMVRRDAEIFGRIVKAKNITLD